MKGDVGLSSFAGELARRMAVVCVLQYAAYCAYHAAPGIYIKLPAFTGEGLTDFVRVWHMAAVDCAFLVVAIVSALSPDGRVVRLGKCLLAVAVLYLTGWAAIDPPSGRVLVAAFLFVPLAIMTLWPLPTAADRRAPAL